MRPCVMVFMAALLFAVVGVLCAQPPDTLWTKVYGYESYDDGWSVQQTQDGGYIVAGSARVAGDDQFYLIKTDANGDTIWTRNYGGPDTDYGYSVQQTQDGGYYVAGYSGGLFVAYFYAVKTDADGDTMWTRMYGGPDQDICMSAQQTQDGGYILAGSTGSIFTGFDVYVVKTDTYGDEIWTSTYGGSGDQSANSVQQTQDGGYIIGANTGTMMNPEWDIYLVKTDANGDTIWTRTYVFPNYTYCWSVKQTQDGGYIVAGSFNVGFFLDEVFLMKTDAGGDTMWTQRYSGGETSYGRSVQQTEDGGYIVAGYTGSNPYIFDVYVIKTDENGNETWSSTYGGTEEDTGNDVQQTSDGGYIVVGYTFSYGAGEDDAYLIRLAPEGAPPEVTVTLTPYNPPITIPAAGGAFDFNVALTNNDPTPATFDAWIMVQLPDLSWRGPVLGPINLTMAGSETLNRDRQQNVPGTAPSGTYLYEGRVGIYPNTVWDSDNFTFEKLETGDSESVGGWLNTGEGFHQWLTTSEVGILTQHMLEKVYPNPFNPTTMLEFSLPQAERISLRVYDISGALVATLVDGWRDAGTHEVLFDAPHLPSGVYFARLTAGEFQQTRKLLLLK